MTTTREEELLALTAQVLDCIAEGDWDTYKRLCHPSLTCFEPEASSHQVEGLDFHRYYFELGAAAKTASTICGPRVRPLGANAAVVSYTRLLQLVDSQGRPQTAVFEETRVWRKSGGQWEQVHFHRSANSR